MSISLISGIHDVALKELGIFFLASLKQVADGAIDAGRTAADAALAANPIAEAAVPVVNTLIESGKKLTDDQLDAWVARLRHLEANQEEKTKAIEALVSKTQ